ncbi:hypothetical protein HHI36_022279, partial [Cryptolaemus montrouzieri]
MSYQTVTITQNIHPTESYVSKAKSTPKPTNSNRKQAIIIHVEGDLRKFGYVHAIGSIVHLTNITHVSRIYNNRICIFLRSEELVDDLIEKYPTVSVNDIQVAMRRLIAPKKRVVISSFCSPIPHVLIETALKNYEFKFSPSITCLKAGIPEEYSHILSFSWQ